jgi:hypothetical protein
VPSTCAGSIGFAAGPPLMLMLITVKMKPTATAVTQGFAKVGVTVSD